MTLIELKDALDAVCLDSYGCGKYDIEYLPDLFLSRLEEVEDGEWTQDYKYQHKATVVKDDEGNHFMLSNNRSGSPFTDWEYGQPSIYQVVPKVKVISTVVWEQI
ncbi:MAG TPA: hypothetical protein VIR31_03680 [Nitrososphaeraceae archaeon]